MQLSRLLLLLTAFIFAVNAATVAERAAQFVSLEPAGNVAIIQNPAGGGNTRLFYQDASGGISVYAEKGRFDVGHTTGGATRIVPANEVMPYTPIAATTRNGFNQFHVFFLSRAGVVSEYFHAAGAAELGWQGGANCTACLTNSGFRSAVGSSVLYATTNLKNNAMGVGFISAAATGTLSEAVKRDAAWVVATLPN